MQPKVINPYSELPQKTADALDFIITNLPASPNFNQLNEVLLTALFGGPGGPLDGDVLPVFLHSVLPLAYNGYINEVSSADSEYVPRQFSYLNRLNKIS